MLAIVIAASPPADLKDTLEIIMNLHVAGTRLFPGCTKQALCVASFAGTRGLASVVLVFVCRMLKVLQLQLQIRVQITQAGFMAGSDGGA
jgi:cation transporter-like permease